MSGLKRRTAATAVDTDIDMVPIMNMFLVLIPFLLMSASFLHIKAINASVPVRSGGENQTSPSDTRITAMVELRSDRMVLSATSPELTRKQLAPFNGRFRQTKGSEYDYRGLVDQLRRIKQAYPASDTLLLMPAKNVRYDTIVGAMDAARTWEDQELFSKVVLSAKVR